VVDHRGGFHDLRIGAAGVPAAATLRAHEPAPFPEPCRHRARPHAGGTVAGISA
jgi:hypothetical protein